MAVKIVETSLRDGHQSLFATRMTTDEVVELAEKLDPIPPSIRVFSMSQLFA